MATYKTPDVYVEEIPVFPPSVAEVGTAIPAFIGYTETATDVADGDLKLKPTKIYSLKEFEDLFGFPNKDKISVDVKDGVATITDPKVSYLLYFSVKMYFDNGGVQCYIVSVGNYKNPAVIDATELKSGLDKVALEDEPTLLVIPEAVKLGSADFATVTQAVLAQCGKLRDRFAIFDIRSGDSVLDNQGLLDNRASFGNDNLKYGAAYYPFLQTAIPFYVPDAEDNVQVTGVPAAAPAGGLQPAVVGRRRVGVGRRRVGVVGRRRQ